MTDVLPRISDEDDAEARGDRLALGVDNLVPELGLPFELRVKKSLPGPWRSVGDYGSHEIAATVADALIRTKAVLVVEIWHLEQRMVR